MTHRAVQVRVRTKSKDSGGRREAALRGRVAFWGFAAVTGLALALSSYRPRGLEPAELDSARYRPISFADLSTFNYVPSAGSTALASRKDPFPPEVRALEGTPITISGIMVPMYVLDGKVREFYLSTGGIRCCFADAPRPTEIIKVTLPPERSTAPLEAARIWGVLEMKEELDDGGFPLPLYRVKGDLVRADRGEETSLVGVAKNAGMITLVVAAGLGFVLNILVPWYRESRIGAQAAFLRQKRM